MAAGAQDDFVTHAAQLIRSALLFQEEHQRLPDGTEPATLLARTMIELAQAAADLNVLLHEWAEDDEHDDLRDDDLNREDDDDQDLDDEDDCEQPTASRVAVRFANVAAWTLRAAAHIHPALRDDPPTQAKDRLLKALDGDAGDWIDQRENWDDLGAEYWLCSTLMLLLGASQGVCKLAGWDPHSDGEVEDDEGRLTADVVTSLLQSGQLAACAVEWFLELPADDTDDAAVDE